ncbi:MAG: PAS domain S-box protein [Deltaproteobacteria bacterium]
MPKFHFTKNRFLATIFCAFVILIAAGWYFTGSLVEMATRTVKEDVHDANLIISLNLINELKKIQNAAVAVAGSPLTLPVLQVNVPENLEKANNILDRYHKSLDAAACYLINFEGLTLASSNRNAKDSFVGQNYTFRPYFQQAIKGDVSQHFAFGTVSRKRGIFASAPVKDKKGNIVGVVVIKKEVEDIEASLQQYIWFLVDQNGIIFMSSQPDVRLKSLWPLDSKLQQKIISSKQYGPEPFPPIMQRQLQRGEEVSFKGGKYLAEQMATPYEGVSVVLLWSTEQISNYRWFGIVLTLLTILLTVSFLAAVYIFTQSNLRMKKLLKESQSQAAALAASELQLTARRDELERQKEQLIQAEERSRLILGSMQEGIWGLDADGKTTFVNRASLDMLGYTEEEVIGKPMHELVHYAYPDGSAYPLEHCHMYQTFVDGKPRTIENEVLWHKDGSSFPVEYTTTPILKKGTLEGSVVTFHDITERKKAEEEFLRTRMLAEMASERFKTLFNASTSGHVIINSSAQIVDCNDTFLRLLGYASLEDVAGKHPAALAPPLQPNGRDSMEMGVEMVGLAIARGRHVFEWVCQNIRGEAIFVEVTIIPVMLDGEPHLMGIWHDLTERKEAEDQVNAYFNSSADGLLILSPKRGFIHANQTAAALFGFENIAELLKCGPVELSPPRQPDGRPSPEAALEYITKAVQMDTPLRFDWIHRRQDKTDFPCEITLIKLQLAGETNLLTSIHDITERKTMEDTIRKDRERMQEILDRSPIIISINGLDGTVLFANPIARDFYGLNIGDKVQNVYVDQNRRAEMLALLKANGKVEDFEIQVYDRERRIRHLVLDVMFIDYAGQKALLVWQVDITERKKAEEAIHIMAERYHMILSSQHSGILVVAEDNKIEFANKIFCEQFGLSETPSELIGLTDVEMIKKILPAYANPAQMEMRIQEIVIQGQSVFEEEISMSNGQFLSRDFQRIVVDGRKSGRLWQHRDITERKKTEEAILEAKNRTDAILGASTNGIVTINEKGVIETFNPAAERIFGYALGEVAGKNVSLLMPDEHADKHDTYLDNYLQTGIKKVIGKRVEVTAKRKNGELFPVEVGISEVLLKEAKLFTAIINDITERRKAEKELKERMDELERFNQITINRELKMIELKEKINGLLKQTGKEEIYKIVE